MPTVSGTLWNLKMRILTGTIEHEIKAASKYYGLSNMGACSESELEEFVDDTYGSSRQSELQSLAGNIENRAACLDDTPDEAVYNGWIEESKYFETEIRKELDGTSDGKHYSGQWAQKLQKINITSHFEDSRKFMVAKDKLNTLKIPREQQSQYLENSEIIDALTLDLEYSKEEVEKLLEVLNTPTSSKSKRL